MNLQDLDKKKLAFSCTRRKLAQELCKNFATGKNLQNFCASFVKSCYFILFYFRTK